MDVREWARGHDGARIETARDGADWYYIAYRGADEVSRFHMEQMVTRGAWSWQDAMSDEQLLANLVWGEARGEGLIGQVAVLITAFTRWRLADMGVSWWGHDLRSILTHPGQFDGLKVVAPDYVVNGGSPYIQLARLAQLHCLKVGAKPFVATHFHAKGVDPYWRYSQTMVPVREIGGHTFYLENYYAQNLNPTNM